jgi:hypothetical protein
MPAKDLISEQIEANTTVNMVSVYRIMLKMLEHIQEKEYTSPNSNVRQSAVIEHDELPNPASEDSTTQG